MDLIPLKLGQWNLYYSSAPDHPWSGRIGLFAQTVLDAGVNILTVQENDYPGTDQEQVVQLAAKLRELAPGNNWQPLSFASRCAIVYNASVWAWTGIGQREPSAWDERWMVWGVFQHVDTGMQCIVASDHWHAWDAQIRAVQAHATHDRLTVLRERYGLQTFLGIDTNDYGPTVGEDIAIMATQPFKDLRAAYPDATRSEWPTWHDWKSEPPWTAEGQAENEWLDQIFIPDGTTVLSGGIYDTTLPLTNALASDHHMLTAVVTIHSEMPEPIPPSDGVMVWSDETRIVSFDVSGKRLGELPHAKFSWTEKVNDSSSLSVEIPYTKDWEGIDVWGLTTAWNRILAVVDGGVVLAAGPIYKPEWDSDNQVLKVSCGGFRDFLKRRLVIPFSKASFSGGVIPTDPDTGVLSDWRLQFQSMTLGSIGRALVEETAKWGNLPPVVLPAAEVGVAERDYVGPDFASVEQRLTDLSMVINGPEFAFTPRLREHGRFIEWMMEWGAPELVRATHRWNMTLPSQPITGLKVNGDSADMAGDAWASGGSQNDSILVAHAHDPWMTDHGYPLMQAADSLHSTVSIQETLDGYVRSMAAGRGRLSYSLSLKARKTDELGMPLGDALLVGDHVNLRVKDPYLGDGNILLKVLELSGNEGEWVSIDARPVIDWEA